MDGVFGTHTPAVAGAYAATVRAQVAILTVLNTEIATLETTAWAHHQQDA
ncbi:MAG: hypothetical protein JWP76_3561 [Dactylosporangium sp.]|nr:hypothetical protein [Dactylosporangium sp.]